MPQPELMTVRGLSDPSSEQAPPAPSPVLEIANIMVRLYTEIFLLEPDPPDT